MRRLASCGALLDRFVAEVTGLGDKLGALLVQLPPKFAFDENVSDRPPSRLARAYRHSGCVRTAPCELVCVGRGRLARQAAGRARCNLSRFGGGCGQTGRLEWPDVLSVARFAADLFLGL